MDSLVSLCRRRHAALTLLVLTVGASSLWAQSNGEIRLEVKDPSGAVTKASGTLRNLDTRADRTFETDAQGVFDFANLPYSRYQIRISKDGFAKPSR